MTGCQAGFSILQVMNDQHNKTEEQDMEIDKGPSDRINETSSNIIDNIYETRKTLPITRLVNEVVSKVYFQDAQQQDENTKATMIRTPRYMQEPFNGCPPCIRLR